MQPHTDSMQNILWKDFKRDNDIYSAKTIKDKNISIITLIVFSHTTISHALFKKKIKLIQLMDSNGWKFSLVGVKMYEKNCIHILLM